jgi:outer membrane protein, heavy metal efflux system
MSLHNAFPKLTWCALGLLLGGCQASSRWVAERVDTHSPHREAVASLDEDLGLPGNAHSSDSPDSAESEEISLTSSEQSALHQEIATLVSVADAEDADLPTESNAVTSLNLATLEQMALENNPAIRQASASASKAAGFRDQVGLYPNPTLTYNGQQLGDAGTDQHMLTLSQDIVTGNKLCLNQQVLNQAVQAQLWEVEAQRQRVLTDVRTMYYEALAAQRRLALATDFQDVAAKGVRVAEARKAALEGSQPEILQAEIQLQEVELQQQQSQYELTAAWKELTAIVGLPDLSLSGLEGELPRTGEARDWDAVFEELASQSPELHAARSRVDRASANLCRQDAQAIPNLGLELGVGRDLGTGSDFAQVGIGVPLPVFNRNEGNISAAHAEYCRATQDYQRLRLSLKARLARAAKDHDSALATVQRYEGQILPKAQQSLSLSEQAYAAAEFDFLQVLTARRTYFESNVRAVDARRQLAQANTLIEGLLLSGGLSETVDTIEDDGLRGQALSGQ